MNVSYSTLCNALKAAIEAHTFPANTPAVMLGARRSTASSGPVAVVDLGNQIPETGIVSQSYGEHTITLLLTVGIPWSDDDQNSIDTWNLAQEIEKIIGSNRELAGVVSVFINSVRPMLFSFLSGSGQQYRGFEYTLGCLDYRSPSGVS